MKKLIDAQTAYDVLTDYYHHTTDIQHEALKDALGRVETVDAVPVRHGRWVHRPEIGWGSTWLCSECGEKTVETIMGEPRYKFCPMCGADMRKDGDHHDSN